MERKAIGFKTKWNPALMVPLFLLGIALVIGGVLFFVFVLRGAIGGGIAGGLIGGGVMLAFQTVAAIFLPQELVHIDSHTVYLYKTSVNIGQIQNIETKGKSVIVITPANGKPVRRGCIKNREECARIIRDAMQALYAGQQNAQYQNTQITSNIQEEE